MSEKHKLAIIGPETVITSFKALGLDTFPTEKKEIAIETIKRLKKGTADGSNKYAVIFVIDSLLTDLNEEDRNHISVGSLPAILSIPSLNSQNNEGINKLKKLAERAIGSDVGNI